MSTSPSQPMPEFATPSVTEVVIGPQFKSSSSADVEVEHLLFVPTQPKATRRVQFRVQKRVQWSPNPILPELGE